MVKQFSLAATVFMHLEEHNHCLMHFLASEHCLGRFGPRLSSRESGGTNGAPRYCVSGQPCEVKIYGEKLQYSSVRAVAESACRLAASTQKEVQKTC